MSGPDIPSAPSHPLSEMGVGILSSGSCRRAADPDLGADGFFGRSWGQAVRTGVNSCTEHNTDSTGAGRGPDGSPGSCTVLPAPSRPRPPLPLSLVPFPIPVLAIRRSLQAPAAADACGSMCFHFVCILHMSNTLLHCTIVSKST